MVTPLPVLEVDGPEIDGPMSDRVDAAALHAAIKAYFGFDDFHVGQREVIEDVIGGRPTLAVMPTGAGKSLCYQLPAVVLGGVTLVVSPLISLMRDQVDALRARGIAAAYLNSSLDADAQRAVIDGVRHGTWRLLYVAPERFRHAAFCRAIAEAGVALFAVDEAHCISRWGHDFRPDYVRLGDAISRLEPPRVLACTATATPAVRHDIVRCLGLGDPAVHVAGFLRTNLFLEVSLCAGDHDKDKRLAAFLKRRFDGSDEAWSGAVIVYASTRKRVERYADVARQALGADAVVAYHAGMVDEQRTAAQTRFMEGRARVAVATNAFGMGVDRADVRAVVHVDMPRTVEAYYQEVGRAGRDREPAHCLLLYNPNDTRVHEFLIGRGHPEPADVARVWSAVRGESFGGPVSLARIADIAEGKPNPGAVEPAIRLLTRVGAVSVDAPGAAWAVEGAPVDAHALGIDFEEVAHHREAEFDRLRDMKRFVHHQGCRHAYVLDYFGDTVQLDCPGCDRCHHQREGGPAGATDLPAGDADILRVRKALAGVARAKGRFGVRKVAAMLAGSKARELSRTSLVELSTFGLLSGIGVDGCVGLLQLLVDRGLCRLRGDDYPLCEITDAGWQVMQGRRAVDFGLPPALSAESITSKRVARMRKGAAEPSGDSAAEHVELDSAIVESLRAFRREEAVRAGVASYIIFHDRTLRAIAAEPPDDRDGFLRVKGLGPAKWDRFGERLVAHLRGGEAPD